MSVKKVGQAELTYEDQKLTFDVIEGSEGERAINIGALRKETGLITYDPGFVNTGSCQSDLTFINGEAGILRHKGYAIDDLAENCSFVEVIYLLIHGALPTQEQLDKANASIAEHAPIPEEMEKLFPVMPKGSHPMATLASAVVALSNFYPDDPVEGDLDTATIRMLAKISTLACYAYRASRGEDYVAPRADLDYAQNLLNMMFGSANGTPAEVHSRAVNSLLVLHADHEQNCSTSVVRMVGSSGANLYASIAAGIGALWGPLHGGANQAVLEMLEAIQKEGISIPEFVEKVKTDKSVRLMGFGHRVYKSYDPRATIAKVSCQEVLEELGIENPLLDLAKQLEEAALNDDYFVKRNLYPNVDYYTGITYSALGFPSDMFTVLFAIGRLPGWIAQWRELKNDPENRIGRPRQVYTGEKERKVPAISERS